MKKMNPFTNTEMETLTHHEALALATEAGCPERIDKFFSNGQEFAWADYVRDAIAKPAKSRPLTTSEKHDLRPLVVRGDK